MNEPVLMPYKIVVTECKPIVYAPYIPLTFTNTAVKSEPTMRQHQNDDQIFNFYTDEHLDALEWIIEETIGRYILLWLDDHQYQVQVRFIDRADAMLFKLKFVDV